MSYTRVTESGHYIWPDKDGIHFDFSFVPNDEMDIFLYMITKYHKSEFDTRVKNGKYLVEEYEESVKEYEL